MFLKSRFGFQIDVQNGGARKNSETKNAIAVVRQPRAAQDRAVRNTAQLPGIPGTGAPAVEVTGAPKLEIPWAPGA